MDLRREAQRRWPVSCLQVKTATRQRGGSSRSSTGKNIHRVCEEALVCWGSPRSLPRSVIH